MSKKIQSLINYSTFVKQHPWQTLKNGFVEDGFMTWENTDDLWQGLNMMLFMIKKKTHHRAINTCLEKDKNKHATLTIKLTGTVILFLLDIFKNFLLIFVYSMCMLYIFLGYKEWRIVTPQCIFMVHKRILQVLIPSPTSNELSLSLWISHLQAHEHPA